MNKFLPEEYYIFTSENPAHESKFGEFHPTLKTVLNFLIKNGETAEILHGKNEGESEKFIMVTSPKNISGLHELACDLGEECGIYSKNGKHQLHFYNGHKRGKVKKGSGTVYSRIEPEGDYITIHTNEGPIYFKHNFESELKRNEESGEDVKMKLEKLNNLKQSLENTKRVFIYIPDHLVIKNSCSHW